MTDELNVDIQFYQLVLSLQAQAWQSLGKVASPLTGKIERSMEQAKFAIDMLEMLQRKTEGNLVEEETQMLKHSLYELRLNYVDEIKKEGEKSTDDSKEKKDDNSPETEGSADQKEQ